MIDIGGIISTQVWYLVIIFAFSFPIAFVTGDVMMGIIPAVSITVFLSIKGFLPLWWSLIILLLVAGAFAKIFILPLITGAGGGGGGGRSTASGSSSSSGSGGGSSGE